MVNSLETGIVEDKVDSTRDSESSDLRKEVEFLASVISVIERRKESLPTDGPEIAQLTVLGEKASELSQRVLEEGIFRGYEEEKERLRTQIDFYERAQGHMNDPKRLRDAREYESDAN